MTIEEILTAKEGEHFEFKTAERRFSYTELQKYASALSNEGGGKEHGEMRCGLFSGENEGGSVVFEQS